MGVVYQCRDERLMRDVAIKMLLPELMEDSSSLEVFRQEARLAAQLEHPSIVTVHEFGEEVKEGQTHHYVVMEYVPGGNLSNKVISGPLAIEHCLNWMKQLASGLAFAHKRGVIHQDIKADNIFITTEGDLKIGDFGLARLLGGRVHSNPMTKGMGTPAYMTPELCRGEPQDHRSDIYSLGVLFFEMATGQLPFKARGMIEMATKHSSAPIPSAKRLNPTIPDVLDKVIKRMMAKTPGERFSSVNDILKLLDDMIFELRVSRLGIGTRPLIKFGSVTAEHYIFQQSSVDDVDVAVAESVPLAPVTEAPAAADEAATHSFAPEQLDDALGADQDAVASASQSLIADLEKQLGSLNIRTTGPALPKSLSTSQSFDAAPFGRPADISAPSFRQRMRGRNLANATTNNLRAITLPGKSKPSLSLEWNFRTTGPIGWSSAPVLDKDEKTLFCASADGFVYKIDATTGREVWRHQTGDTVVTSPVVTIDRIVVANSAGAVSAVDSKYGQLLWVRNLNDKFVSTPAADNDFVYAGGLSGKVYSFDCLNGDTIWSSNFEKPIVGGLIRHASLVLFGTKNGDFYALQSDTGDTVWRFGAGGAIVASPVASVDTVYFGTQEGDFCAIAAENGALIWTYPCDSPIVGKAVIAFTSVMFCCQNNWIYCCDKYDGTLRWKAPVHGKVLANLVATRELLFCVTQDGWLQAFDNATGSLRWQKEMGGQLESTPLVSTDKIYIGSVQGILNAYSLSEALTVTV